MTVEECIEALKEYSKDRKIIVYKGEDSSEHFGYAEEFEKHDFNGETCLVLW